MSELLEKSGNESKELSVYDAKLILDSAIEKINRNRVRRPSVYGYSDTVQSAIMLLTGIASICGSTVLFGLNASFTLGSWTLFLGVASSALGIYMYIDEYNGDPRRKIRSSIANMLSTRKMRKKLKAHQAEYSRYYDMLEVFRLYVESVKGDLEQQGVFKALDTDKEKIHQLDGDGYYSSLRKATISESEKDNNRRIRNMMEEISNSPSMKEIFSERDLRIEEEK